MFIYPTHSVSVNASYVLVTRQVHGTSAPRTSRCSNSITQNGAHVNLFVLSLAFIKCLVQEMYSFYVYYLFNLPNNLT